MVILNVDHPDINDFIQCKVKEEQKAWHLMQAGYDGSGPDSEAYSSIFFQNANNSVRVTDEFMRAVETDGTFVTRTVKERTPVNEFKARDLMHSIAEATWQCGDPGMQFDSTINRWHTSKNSGRINASNPCSEYMFLDDSACNLASFNLQKFYPGGQFDIPSSYRSRRRHDTGIVTTTAMEIIVDAAGLSHGDVSAKNLRTTIGRSGSAMRTLGALLMAFGLPYDSDAGRDFAATGLTSSSLRAMLTGSLRVLRRAAPALGAADSAARSRRTLPVGRAPASTLATASPSSTLRPDASRRRSITSAGRRTLLTRSSSRSSTSSSTPAAMHGTVRLPMVRGTATARAGHWPKPASYRHHRLHDGLRHYRHRA